MQTFSTDDDNNLNISVTTREDLNKLLSFTLTSTGAVVDLTGKTFTAAVLHGTSSTTITVTNTDLTNGQITLTLDKASHATIGAGVHRWYLTSVISGVDVEELSGTYTIS
jgi:hypothetical protein